MLLDKLLPTKRVSTADPIRDLVQSIGQIRETKSLSDPSIGGLVLAAESLSSDERAAVTSTANNLRTTIESIISEFGGNIAVEGFQEEAATIAGMIATNPYKALTTPLKSISVEGKVVASSAADGNMERGIATEAYDERANREAQMYSILYNLLASRQDEFGETLFPTIIINPTEVGVLIALRMFMVYNDFKRSVSGSLADYGRVNVIRAYADAEVLKNELVRAIPVLRKGGSDSNEDLFLDTDTEVSEIKHDLGTGVTVTSAALKVDNKVDLIGLSQTNELLASGVMGPTDNLDAAVKLEAVYLKVVDADKTDVIRIDVANIPGSSFVASQQGNSRRMLLDLDTSSVVLSKDTKNARGGALEALTELASATASARIQLNLSGSVVLDKGELIVNRGTASLVVLRNAGDEIISGGAADTLAAKLAEAEVIGYDIKASRANSNIRQIGQLLETQDEYRIIQVPYRSPISALSPVMATAGTEDDSSKLQTLITATGIRVSNEAVTTLLRADQVMAAYIPVANAQGDLPELDAIGSNYVKPVYVQDSIDLSKVVDSVKSHERLKDIRAALVEKIRFHATEMYRQSEYKAAADVLTGNIGYKPTVIVATDPVLYNYIQADGELTALGDKFDVKVVSTLDVRMKGKVFVTFGVFDGNRNTAINPLNFGNMLYGSELVANLPVGRDGRTSNELIVTPRFLHIFNLPVLARFDVTNMPQVIEKVPGYRKTVS